jgi:hypothetical protein
MRKRSSSKGLRGFVVSRPINEKIGEEGRKVGSKVPPAIRRARRRKK